MKKPTKLISIVVILASAVTGCATSNITPQYVSPNNYQSYDCSKLQQEYNRINTYADGIKNQPNKLSTRGINIGMYGNRHGVYPSINVGLGSNRNTEARDSKLSRLYGERDAIIQAGRLQKCTFTQGLKIFGES